MQFDASAAKALVEGLGAVADETELENNLKLSDVVPLVDWFTGDEDPEEGQRRLETAIKGLDKAFDEFDRMREEEGGNLEKDFRERLKTLVEFVGKVESRSDDVKKAQLQKLRERIEKYVPSDKVDEGRLEQEVAYLLEKLDVTEEIVRLRSHVQLFEKALDEGGIVGKRLNFILQEMNREINTIGSKASDGEIASWVVAMKEEAEKIREQVQNVA
jgi:uncharacterized protein (TIGR00255 family)